MPVHIIEKDTEFDTVKLHCSQGKEEFEALIDALKLLGVKDATNPSHN